VGVQWHVKMMNSFSFALATGRPGGRPTGQRIARGRRAVLARPSRPISDADYLPLFYAFLLAGWPAVLSFSQPCHSARPARRGSQNWMAQATGGRRADGQPSVTTRLARQQDRLTARSLAQADRLADRLSGGGGGGGGGGLAALCPAHNWR
jgi:hypothetical protein